MYPINKIRHPFPDEPRRPVQHNRGGQPRLYPFYEMEIGDSFDVPVETLNVTGKPLRLAGLSVVANNWAWRLNRGFIVREIESPKVFRCWRTK